MSSETVQHFDLPREQAAQVVVPLGLDLGLYPAADGSLSQPRVRVGRSTRVLDVPAYQVWKAARAVSESGRLLSVPELAEAIPGAGAASVAAVIERTPEIRLVAEQTDDVLLLWMVTNLRPLMVNVGPAVADGALQIGLVDERFDFLTPQIFDVLLRCQRVGSVAEAYSLCAKDNAAAGVREVVWTEPFGLLRAMWSELPFLLAHGVAWLDVADAMYSPKEPA
ncbi:hypothetical protein EK0264_11590 [Epidermidibacterium keratini]|uniref:Uncharacterized protein n=1 Tax=Epidermidibacterium keratini TaxID=1891644 RepID=A0A7L4YPA4_9ACTN|nr:hypothetical protein [Epidermidibacterium keratini]QHC00862.1 hypothetical protein EK0264_11590 [Epidermidibacterium keratini]